MAAVQGRYTAVPVRQIVRMASSKYRRFNQFRRMLGWREAACNKKRQLGVGVGDVRPTIQGRPSTVDLMETFAIDGYPEISLTLALFKDVTNATWLKSKHLNTVALIDAGGP